MSDDAADEVDDPGAASVDVGYDHFDQFDDEFLQERWDALPGPELQRRRPLLQYKRRPRIGVREGLRTRRTRL